MSAYQFLASTLIAARTREFFPWGASVYQAAHIAAVEKAYYERVLQKVPEA